ncbi:unnamed protein product [Colias eurytheme]|nr:unnamed protein product [Colias eurytheme]
MSSTRNKCSACTNTISNREYLVCSSCRKKYDLQCANVTSKAFHNNMNLDQKNNWICPECVCKQPKCDNTNTPIRMSKAESLIDTQNITQTSASGEGFINMRTRGQRKNSFNSEADSNDYVTKGCLRDILKEELSKSLNVTMGNMVSDQLKSIQHEISSFKESLNFFNAQFELLKTSLDERNVLVDELKNENNKLKSTVLDLGTRLHIVEQQLRENNIEINGIPENKGEILSNTLGQLAKTVGAPLDDSDILHVTRVAKYNKDSSRPRSVIAKLRSTRIRDTVLAAVSKYNKNNPENKLSSQHLGIAGRKSPVFVSEHLTPANKQLHAATRQKAKELGYRFVWIRNAKIFVRKHEFGQVLTIRNDDSLKALK